MKLDLTMIFRLQIVTEDAICKALLFKILSLHEMTVLLIFHIFLFMVVHKIVVLIQSYFVLHFTAPSKPIIDTLGWTTIQKLVQSEVRVMVFRSVNELSPQ